MDYVQYINRHFEEPEEPENRIYICRDLNANRQAILARGAEYEMRILQAEEGSNGSSWASIETPPEPRGPTMRDLATPCFPECMSCYQECKRNMTKPIVDFMRYTFLIILTAMIIWIFFFYWVHHGITIIKNNGTEVIVKNNFIEDN